LHLLNELDLLLKLRVVGGSQGVALEVSFLTGFISTLVLCFEFLEPRHVHHSLHVGPLGAVLLEHGGDARDRLLADLIPGREREVGLILDGLPRNLFIFLIVEGKHSRHQ
jgi:hypothetical protein